MQAPVDYPITDTVRDVKFSEDELTYAALLERMESSEPVTHEMILQARLGIEMAQAIPEAPKPKTLPEPGPFAAITQSLLAGEAAEKSHDVSAVLSRWTRAIR